MIDMAANGWWNLEFSVGRFDVSVRIWQAQMQHSRGCSVLRSEHIWPLGH
jgi:hypothetical protein